MNITILSDGSRGDVQPFLALALGLRKAGHQVQLAAPGKFDGFITLHGVASVPLVEKWFTYPHSPPIQRDPTKETVPTFSQGYRASPSDATAFRVQSGHFAAPERAG